MIHVPTDEFVDFGYLQEVNRLFLHTLGLALMVKVHDSGRVELAGIWRTDDPEGFYFEELDAGKAQRVNNVAEKIALARVKALGYVVQPVDRS